MQAYRSIACTTVSTDNLVPVENHQFLSGCVCLIIIVNCDNVTEHITSAGEVMYLSYSVFLSVCLCPEYLKKSCEQILNEILFRGGAWPTRKFVDFGGDPDSFANPGLFSRILYR